MSDMKDLMIRILHELNANQDRPYVEFWLKFPNSKLIRDGEPEELKQLKSACEHLGELGYSVAFCSNPDPVKSWTLFVLTVLQYEKPGNYPAKIFLNSEKNNLTRDPQADRTLPHKGSKTTWEPPNK